MVEPKGRLDWLRSLLPSFPRTRQSSDVPPTSGKPLDARLSPGERAARVRGNDEPTRGGEPSGSDAQPPGGATAPVYIAAKRGEPKRRDGRGSGS